MQKISWYNNSVKKRRYSKKDIKKDHVKRPNLKHDHPKKLYIYINRNEVKGPQDI
jgi:hypothetical protein